MGLNIVVYDDYSNEASKLVKRLQSLKIPGALVTSLSDSEFNSQLKTLTKRIENARSHDTVYLNDDDSDKTFDNADVLVVDYDLFKANELLTGENVAYNARCFSSCGVIVALNQFGDTDFDLTLRGHPESYADVNISIANLDNGNLWGKFQQGFRPWYWLNVPSAASDFEKKVEDVERAIAKDFTICEMLEIDEHIFSSLPRTVSQFIGKSIDKLKVRDFIAKSGNGFRLGDIKASDYIELASRVGAARIGNWIETTLLPGQDFLIDAPHLVLRYPSLLGGTMKLKDWNAVTRLENRDECSELSSVIEPYRLKRRHWASRPVWVYPQLCEDRNIDEVSDPWSAKYSPFCFCEDTSEFCEPKSCAEFVADTDSQFARRYVKKLPGIKYRPEIRFAM
jgi:hypothetical protein